jgi:hypothetical protein
MLCKDIERGGKMGDNLTKVLLPPELWKEHTEKNIQQV